MSLESVWLWNLKYLLILERIHLPRIQFPACDGGVARRIVSASKPSSACPFFCFESLSECVLFILRHAHCLPEMIWKQAHTAQWTLCFCFSFSSPSFVSPLSVRAYSSHSDNCSCFCSGALLFPVLFPSEHTTSPDVLLAPRAIIAWPALRHDVAHVPTPWSPKIVSFRLLRKLFHLFLSEDSSFFLTKVYISERTIKVPPSPTFLQLHHFNGFCRNT